jgi:hypothetical protein
MVEKVCARCGLSRLEWRGNDGQGYLIAGLEYCCLGCAEDTGCTCRAEPSHESSGA